LRRQCKTVAAGQTFHIRLIFPPAWCISVKLKSSGEVIMAQEGKLESTSVHGYGEGFPNEIVLANGRHVACGLWALQIARKS
jgi:hypothetical protein